MNVLVTGAMGFIGKNIVEEIHNREYGEVFLYGRENEDQLFEYCSKAELIIHLLGVNRPQSEEEFVDVNVGFTKELLETLKKFNNKSPIIFTSSIQASLDNPYGKSKAMCEELLINYAEQFNVDVSIFRLPNVFGKWCKPNYNSVVATFCHNISRDLPIKINDRDIVLKLTYIDDVVDAILKCGFEESTDYARYKEVVSYDIKLGELVEILYGFKQSRKTLIVPKLEGVVKKLYSTYLSYLEEDNFDYDLTSHVDVRGSFTEFLRFGEYGQVSVNVIKPNIVKGNHWHHTKNEKFLVVKGTGLIRFRKIGTKEIIEYNVSDSKYQVVDIPVGYTHSIENVGNEDMVVIMWANEMFDPEKPDTFFVEV